MKILHKLHRVFRLLLCLCVTAVLYLPVVLIVSYLTANTTNSASELKSYFSINSHYKWWSESYDSLVKSVKDFLNKELG